LIQDGQIPAQRGRYSLPSSVTCACGLRLTRNSKMSGRA
jgi:hypothetical protein